MFSHQKGKSNASNANTSYQSTSNTHAFSSKYENPSHSIYYQSSRRGSYDNSLGAMNFSGFFSPSNPGNFYSFEQPIVFNSISNINLMKPKKKQHQNDSIRQYLDTIKEVYKPRHNKTLDFVEELRRTRGYLHGGPLDNMKGMGIKRKDDEENAEIIEYGGDYIDEQRGKSKNKGYSMKQEFHEEKQAKYFILPEIDKNKKKTSKTKKTFNSFQDKHTGGGGSGRNVIGKKVDFKEENVGFSGYGQMVLDNISQRDIKSPKNERMNSRYNSCNEMHKNKEINEKIENNEYFLENIRSRSKKNQEVKGYNGENETKIGEFRENQEIKTAKFITIPKKIIEDIKNEDFKQNNTSELINNNNTINNDGDIKQIKDINEVNEQNSFGIIKNNENINEKLENDENKRKSHESSENEEIKLKSHEYIENNENQHKNNEILQKTSESIKINIISHSSNDHLQEKIDNLEEKIINLQEKIETLQTNSIPKLPQKNVEILQNGEIQEIQENLQIRSNNISFISNNEDSTTPIHPAPNNSIPTSPELKPRDDHEEDEQNEPLLPSPPLFPRRKTIKTKQLSDKTLTKGHSIIKELIPYNTSVIRRGTNTSGIENSLSFMRKIFEDPENDEYLLKSQNIVKNNNNSGTLQRMDSLTTHSTPRNSLKNEIKFNFCKKNEIYGKNNKNNRRASIKTVNRDRQNSKIGNKLTQNFKKKTMKFLKLLKDLQNSFRNASEETNSFIFIESRFQSEEKPLLNLAEILRKKTLEEHNLPNNNNLPSSYSIPNKLVKSGTFLTEKLNSGLSFSSPKTQISTEINNNSNNSVFFINVHPPLKDEVILESMEETFPTIRGTTIREEFEEMDKQRKRMEEMKFSVEEEQKKMLKLQIFSHKKLWKLSLGFSISIYKGLAITEKEYFVNSVSNYAHIKIFDIKNYQMKPLEMLNHSVKIEDCEKHMDFNYKSNEDEVVKNYEGISDRSFKELEDESYEEIFEDGSFLEDFKQYEENKLKFYINGKLEGELEVLGIRKKANNFLGCIKEVILPISTKLDEGDLNAYSPVVELEDTHDLNLKDAYENYVKVNRVSQQDPKSLIVFYRAHYLNYFSIYGLFEDEITIPMFENINSPMLKKLQKTMKKPTQLHIPLDLSNHSLPPSPMLKSETLIVQNSSIQENIPEISFSLQEKDKIPLKFHLNHTKSDRAMKKQLEKPTILEDDSITEHSPNMLNLNEKSSKVPPFQYRKDLRTQTTISENIHNNYLNVNEDPLITPSHFNKDDKKLSFSMGTSKIMNKNEKKEFNTFKFINNIKKNKEKYNQKFSKSSKNLDFDMKTVDNNNNKMDKSSLFFRNQLINLNKIKNLDPIEQMIWAIKHNNIHKIEEIFLTYPSISIDSRDEEGNSFLSLASQIGNFEIANLFLLKGATPNTQNINGNTALHLALSYNNDQIVDKLIAYGAQENIKNSEGKTPWDMYLKK